jgi:hypothetical protein
MTGINGSSRDPAGARTYRGGVPAANALATVRRLIPKRLAISRCDFPSFSSAPISAHSNALNTSPGLLLVDIDEQPETNLGRHRSGALLDS